MRGRRAEFKRDVAMSIEEIITAALQYGDPAARAAYVEEACGDDAVLRQRVVALLATQQAAGAGVRGTSEGSDSPVEGDALVLGATAPLAPEKRKAATRRLVAL